MQRFERSGSRCVFTVAATLTMLVAAPVGAQQTPDVGLGAEEPQEERRQLRAEVEEITVTARKREETILEAPLSVTAFSADSLRDYGFTSIEDIDQAVPNIKFDQTDSPGGQDTRVFLRGVGQTDPIITADPGVAIYLDGVYIPRSQGGLLDLIDLERVEVLRGPQGTLFGRNTIGGAINIVSRKPSFDFDARATVRIGNYNLFETNTVVNIPLIHEFAALRASFATTTRDGWASNRGGGGDVNDRKFLGGRASLLLTPTENLEIVITGERTRAHQAPSHIECNDFGKTGVQDLSDLQSGIPGNSRAQCSGSETDDELKTAQDTPLKNNLDTLGWTATVGWDLNERHSFKSISSWRRLEPEGNLDIDATALPDLPLVDIGSKQWSMSQELIWNGSAMDGRLTWVAGLFGMRELARSSGYQGVLDDIPRNRADVVQRAILFSDPDQDGSTADSAPFELFPWACGAGHVVGVFACGTNWADLIGLGISGNGGDFNITEVTNLAYAAYGQLSFDLTDQLHFTAGLRRSHEKKEYETVNFSRFCNPSGDFLDPDADVQCGPLSPAFTPLDLPFAHDRNRFDNWSPTVNLSYDFTDNVLGYFTWSRGWKSGGFNGRSEFIAQLTPYNEELLRSIEVGLKGTLFDNRVRFGLAGFFNLYDDIQLVIFQSIPDPDVPGSTLFASFVSNAGEAVIQGLELELEARLAPGLTVGFAGGLTNAQFKEFTDTVSVVDVSAVCPGAEILVSPDGSGICPKDRTDDDFQDVPPFNYNVYAQYAFELLDLGILTSRVTWYSAGDYFSDIENTEKFRQKKFGLLNGRIALALNDDKTEIALWGKNLLDRRYKAGGVTFETSLGFTWSFYGPPRQYGIEILRRF